MNHPFFSFKWQQTQFQIKDFIFISSTLALKSQFSILIETNIQTNKANILIIALWGFSSVITIV